MGPNLNYELPYASGMFLCRGYFPTSENRLLLIAS